MVRKKFKLPNDATVYNVNVESEKGKEWLNKNTNAQAVEEEEKEEEEVTEQGNQQDPAPSATAGSETAAQDQEAGQPQNNQQQDTESASEDTSSELPEAYKNLESLQSQLAESKKGLEEFDYEAQLKDMKASIDEARIMGDQDAYERSVNKYNNVLSDYKGKVESYNSTLKEYDKLYKREKLDYDEELKRFREDREKNRDKAFDIIDESKTPNALAPDFLKSWMASLGGSVLTGISGGVEFVTGTGEDIVKGLMEGKSRDEILHDASRGKDEDIGEVTAIMLQGIDIVKEKLETMTRKEYDEETGEELEPLDLIQKGRVLDAGGLAAEQAVSSVYSLFIPALNPVAGAAYIGTTVYGQEYRSGYERFKPGEMTEEDLAVIKKASFLKVGAEVGGELLGAHLFKKASGLIRSGATKDVVKEFNRGFLNRALRGYAGGYAGEYLSESLTSVMQDLVDKNIYGDEKTFKDIFRNSINSGLVGGLLGGTTSGTMRAVNPMTKTEIQQLLAGKQWQGESIQLSNQLLKAQKALKDADGKDKPYHQKRVDLIKKKIEGHNRFLKSSFDSMTNKEMENYASTVDQINKERDIAFDGSLDIEIRDEAKENILKLYNKLNTYNNGFLNVNVENKIGDILKAREVIEQRKGERGFGKDLKVKYLKTPEEVDALNIKGFKNADGVFLDGDTKTIYINEQVAAKTGNVDVLGHELLHYIMSKNFKTDNASMKPLVDSFKKYLVDSGNKDVLDRIEHKLKENDYFDKKTGEIKKDALEEYFNMFAEIANETKDVNEKAASPMVKAFKDFWVGLGFSTIKLDNGKDVFDFIKTYNKNVNREGILGEITKRRVTRTKLESSKAEAADGKKSSKKKFSTSDAKIPIDKLGQVDGDGMSMTEPGMGNFLYQAEADEVVRKIKEEGYLDNLIAAKYKVRPVPQDFVQDVLAELTPHIKAFKPESNDSLFGWIQSQIANKASRVYNTIYKNKGPAKTVDVDATTSEGAPVIQLEADTDIEMQRIDEMGLNDEQVQERSKFRQKLKLNDNMIDKVINAVKKVFGTKLPNINTKQFKQALTKAFKTDLKKPMQDLMGKGKAYDAFLEKFMPVIHKFFPVEVLVQMERNVKPELRIFTSSRRITKPTEVDKLISQGKLPKDTNRDSGPLLNTKLPYPGAEKILAFYRGKNMLEVLGYEVGGSTLGTRKDVLAERTITEVAFDAVSTVIQDETVASKIEDLNIAGIDKVENDLAMIAKQIDRDPTIKFSRSAIGVNKENVKPFLSKYNQVLNRINSNETLATDKKGLKKIIKEVYDGILDNTEMNNVVKKIIRYSTDFQQQKDKRKGVVDIDIRLTDYINEATEKDVLDKSILQLLSSLLPGGYKTAAAFFNDKIRVNKARSSFGSFVNHLKEDLNLSENEILRLLHTQYKGMYASSSKIAAGQFQVVFKDGAYVVVEGDGEIGTHRGQVFENVEDFYRVAGIKNYKDKLKNINTKTFKEKSKDAVKDKDYDGRLKQALEARKAVTMIMDFYMDKIKNGELDYGDLLMLGKMFGSNMLSPMKRAANLTYIAEGIDKINPKDMGRLTEYEHMIPTNVMILKLFAAYVNDGKISKNFWDGYEVAVIPKTMDKVLIKNGLRDFLPVSFKEGDANWKRYFNKQTLGENNLAPLVHVKTGEVIGADFVKASNLLNTTEVGQKGAQLIQKVSVKYSKSKGMSTFDFDETLIIGGKNFVVATDPKTGKTAKISSEEWPIKGPDYADAGWTFDFSDFANVRGGKEGPLLQKMRNQIEKYGNKNVFVLTARQQASAGPIQQWLKSKGINLPLRNITGLGKSEGSAKGEWMLQKFAEGYNDMYFVDDALPNVEAVKKVLDQLDIKSKVVQAKVKFSKSASQDFNDMLERSKGVDANIEISDIDAKLRGAKRDRFKLRFFVPPSAEDLKGLVYAFLGKGERGNKDMQWFKDNLFTPFAKGTKELNSLRQKMSEEYTALKKQFPNVVKSLNDKVANTEFTVDNAIRVYLWNQAGFDVPGLSEAQNQLLVDHVANNPELIAFADVLSNITRTEEGYVKPKDYWITQNVGSDLHTVAETINREKFLAEWQENADLIFSKENLNKIEAIYGSNFREALEDMLYRMRTGSNRPSGRTSVENKFLNWVNGAVSAVMFFNMRSAGLQGLSMVNFLNFEDNNIFKASKAFANQKQFWADFLYLFNSDMLKQRRAGLKIDVSASELTDAFAQGKNKTEAVIKYLLEKGFIPTKMMDSFAIAMGGSTFYRNRVEKLIKQGMSKTEAQDQAFLDFQEIAEETQQSSRPDLISMQQASSLGRLILAWANTPMQYTRLTKKALSDIINRRGDTKANVSRILYYGAIQNIIFGTLQTGLAFLMFGDDEEDKNRDKKEQRVLNGMLDTLLRGVGVYGALVSAAKNTLMQAHEELGKGYGQKDYSKIMQQLINLSPPIGSKVRKIIGAIKSYDFNKDIMDQMGHGINNPAWNVFTGVVEGVTNAPLDRMRAKMVNVREAFVGDHEMWQRVALVMGWNKWDLNVRDAEVDDARKQVKDQKKEDKKKVNSKKHRCVATRSSGGRCSMTVEKKGGKCVHHRPFKDGSDNDGDGLKEYKCKGTTSSGKRCKNKTENKNKKCYAHQ